MSLDFTIYYRSDEILWLNIARICTGLCWQIARRNHIFLLNFNLLILSHISMIFLAGFLIQFVDSILNEFIELIIFLTSIAELFFINLTITILIKQFEYLLSSILCVLFASSFNLIQCCDQLCELLSINRTFITCSILSVKVDKDSPDPSASNILKVHLSLSDAELHEVMLVANTNCCKMFKLIKLQNLTYLTLNVMIPRPSLSNSLKIWLTNILALCFGMSYISYTLSLSRTPWGHTAIKPLKW